ncbi:MAG: YitT family protein [Oscillospiraceae bacterium]|nr:YitT family protein [Oscillospiraceae bacterium]
MDSIKKSLEKKKALKYIMKYLVIVLGAAVYAVGFQFFLFPNAIVSGGLVGIAMIINVFTSLPVGMLTFVMNVPLFLVAWKHFGLDFLLSSLAGVALSALLVDLFALRSFVATNDPMLASIIGGVIKGAGLGMIYYVGATTGGVDIVAKFLRQRHAHIQFGTLILILDFVIIAAYAFVLGRYESAMYSLIAMFVVSKVIDLVLYGIDNSSVCYIISEHSDELITEITSGRVHRGVTILNGAGAYSGKPEKILMCVIKRNQISEFRRLIRSIDPHSFCIVTDAKDVFGKGFENIAEVK